MNNDIIITIIVITITLMGFIFLVIIMLLLNSQRRLKHKTEMETVRLNHQKEITTVVDEIKTNTSLIIGREIHDNVGQLLNATKLSLLSDKHKDTTQKSPELMEYLDEAITELRHISKGLTHPDILTQTGLPVAIEKECKRLNKLTGINIITTFEDNLPPLSDDETWVMYRLFQEIINNSLKHAQATEIKISVSNTSTYKMCIEDNGKGFNVEKAKEKAAGSGLRNIESRCTLIGFKSIIHSKKGEGTIHTISRLQLQDD